MKFEKEKKGIVFCGSRENVARSGYGIEGRRKEFDHIFCLCTRFFLVYVT